MVEWLECLKILKEAGFTSAPRKLYNQCDVEWAEKELLPSARIIFRYHPEPAGRRVKLFVNPALVYITDYRVERLEILAYLALESLANLDLWGAPELGAACIKVGCANTRLMSPRERWRRIGVELDPRLQEGARAESLVSKMYEDRPKCGWCKSPIATLSASPTRKDLHESCHQYILKVVKPQVLAERKAQQQQKAL